MFLCLLSWATGIVPEKFSKYAQLKAKHHHHHFKMKNPFSHLHRTWSNPPECSKYSVSSDDLHIIPGKQSKPLSDSGESRKDSWSQVE